MSGACGNCTLCCTVMKVTMPDRIKPAHETCAECTAKGCAIYAGRPDACAGFQCVWLASQQSPQLALARDLRPDRCGVVLDMNAAGTILAHCEFPASWKGEPVRSFLLTMVRRGLNVLLDSRHGTRLLNADGTTVSMRFIGVDPHTHNRLYVREPAL